MATKSYTDSKLKYKIWNQPTKLATRVSQHYADKVMIDPASRAEAYEEAARGWIHEKKPKKALRDYRNAAQLYELAAYFKSEELGDPKIEIPEGSRAKLYEKDEEDLEEEETKSPQFYLSKAEKARKMAGRLNKVLKNEWHGLAFKVKTITAVIAVTAGIFLLSPYITGNAIADLSTKTTSFLGAGLIILGLVGCFFWMRNRKKK